MDERLNLREFGDFAFDLKNDVLTRDGARVPLQPQPAKVLRLLITRAGDLVTRQELKDAVWSDGTFVDFDQGLNWCIKRIREVLGDDATAPRFIETVPRKGYRFIGAIRQPGHASRPSGWWRWAVATIVLALIAVGRTPTVTIVVLPFDNYTGDPRNEMAANVTTEDVINRVGSIDPARVKVIDRMTATKFKRTNECIIHIGRALGADFVMEGAVGPRHTTAALYRVADNTQVWSTAVESDGEVAPAKISAKIAATFVR